MEAAININHLRVRTIIGVDERERVEPQDVLISINLLLANASAAVSGDLDKTVDYRALQGRIVGEVKAARFRLLEELAAHLLKIVMEDPKVLSATVQVDKPGALPAADSVSVICKTGREA